MFFIVLAAAFSLWMLVDAARRGAEAYWYFIILLLPFGQWIYFFVVKIHDWRTVGGMQPRRSRAMSLDALRELHQETPSTRNKLALGHALYAKGDFHNAAALFVEVLQANFDDREALHGLALCEIGAKEFAAAAPRLQQLTAADPAFADFEPWFDLAFALWNMQRRSEAISALEQLVHVSPRLKHKSILAKYLARDGQIEQARKVLDEVFADYDSSDGFVKQSNARWIADARQTDKDLRAR